MRTRTSGAGKSSEASGFTLLELVVVMLILTVALGLVLPQTSSLFLRSDLKTSSRRLAGAVAYARSQAMLEGRLWELTLDLDANAFWANPAGQSDHFEVATGRKRTLEGAVRFVDVQKVSDGPLSVGEVVLRFQPKGLVEPSVIHLAGPGNRVQTLIIKPYSGRVQVLDGYEEQQEQQGT